MVTSEEFFLQEKNYFLKDDSCIFMDKDYASFFYKSSENSPKNGMKFLDEDKNFDFNLNKQNIDFDLNFYKYENYDSFRAINHIKNLYYKKEFEEILKFVLEYFPNVKLFLIFLLFFIFLKKIFFFFRS
jgi:hypothetical protein